MFKAILFDLDGTLLDIDMDIFLKQYFMAMMKSAQELGYKYPAKLVEQVYRSTDVMLANRCADITNEETFMTDFLKACSYPELETRQFFDDFYREVFPGLQSYCRPFPVIPSIMEKVLERGYKIVIATNPVFPLSAVTQRIHWAGLGHFSFDLITSYENMHFTKPHPEYFLEISELIGVPPGECLMVGNDVDEDLAAGIIGMHTFLVENLLIDKGESGRLPDWRGDLNVFFRFISDL